MCEKEPQKKGGVGAGEGGRERSPEIPPMGVWTEQV